MSECWIWKGGIMLNGYGQLKQITYGTRYAHQWACSYWNKSPLPVEKGHCVKHKCDVRLCVNPEHLEYGTLKENIKEMIERNPKACGKKEPTEDEIELLKEMIAENVPRRQMSKQLGHSRNWLDRIKKEYT